MSTATPRQGKTSGASRSQRLDSDDTLHQLKDTVTQKARQVQRKVEEVEDDLPVGLPKLTTMVLIAVLFVFGALYLADLGSNKSHHLSYENPYELEARPFYKRAVHKVHHAVNRVNPFHREPKHFTIIDWLNQEEDESFLDKIDRTLHEYYRTAERLAGFEPKPRGLWNRAKRSASETVQDARSTISGKVDKAKDKAQEGVDNVKDFASDSYESLNDKLTTLRSYLKSKGVELNDAKDNLKDKAQDLKKDAYAKKRDYEKKLTSAWKDHVTTNADRFKRTSKLAQKEAELKSRTVAEKATGLKDRLKNFAHQKARQAGDKLDEAKDYAHDARNQAHSQFQQAKNSAQHAGQYARETAEDAYEDGVDKVHGIKNKVGHQANVWKERAKEFTESWFGKNQQARMVEEAEDKIEALREKLEQAQFKLEYLRKNKLEE